MLEPSKGMALFVLRIAGLLSIETARENVTAFNNSYPFDLPSHPSLHSNVSVSQNLQVNNSSTLKLLEDFQNDSGEIHNSNHLSLNETKPLKKISKNMTTNQRLLVDDKFMDYENQTEFDGASNAIEKNDTQYKEISNIDVESNDSLNDTTEWTNSQLIPHETIFSNYLNPVNSLANTPGISVGSHHQNQTSIKSVNQNVSANISADHNQKHINGDNNEQQINSKDHFNTQNIQRKETDKTEFASSRKRGAGFIQPQNISRRNNPYPYGPKYLPTAPPAKYFTVDPLEANTDLYYDYDYSDGKSSSAAIETPSSNKFIVITEKPAVLFQFSKPGYKPNPPEDSLPPTRTPTPGDPWDCNPRCPKYKLIDWNPDYEVRQYPPTTWISTVIIAENRILAELEGYMRIQDYFYGLNDRGLVMNLTVPFLTQIQHANHPAVSEEPSDYALSLFLDHKSDPYDAMLPTPISNEVLVDRLDSKTIFTSGFEANFWEVTDEFLEKKLSQLIGTLKKNGESFLDRYYYLATYSRPELYQPLYFEMWVYATAFRTANSKLMVQPRKRPPPSVLTKKTKDKLCRGIECPPFEVLRKYRYGIQKRRYYDSVFAMTSLGVCEFSTASIWQGFMPLHLYKHGINSHMEIIEATRPIALVKVTEDSSPTTECPQNMTMAVYLPERLHTNPPLTGYAAPNVAIKVIQHLVVYAYTVGGYILEPIRMRKELSDLKYRLTEFGACFKKDEYYVVVYDFIVRYHGRQNEIWIVAENCKATKNK